MTSTQVALAELENFLIFQIQHTQRHRLQKFIVTVEKAKYLLNKIQETKTNPVPLDASSQDNYNAWFTQEIDSLREQVFSLNERVSALNAQTPSPVGKS